MSKPLGMDATFRTIMPSRAMDLIWDAVTEAQCEGASIEDFIREARQSWAQQLRDEAAAVEASRG